MRENPREVAEQLTEMLREVIATYGVRINLAEITAINEGSRSGGG